jgi:hypothetical protein
MKTDKNNETESLEQRRCKQQTILDTNYNHNTCNYVDQSTIMDLPRFQIMVEFS